MGGDAGGAMGLHLDLTITSASLVSSHVVIIVVDVHVDIEIVKTTCLL